MVFFEFVIDPACSIAFEAEPADEEARTRPPRPPHEPLFDFRALALALAQGAAVLLAVALVYGYATGQGAGENEARATAFTTIVLGNLGPILANRSASRTFVATLSIPNRALWWVVGTLVGLAAALYVPALRERFRFAPLHADHLAACALAAAGALAGFELYKALRARFLIAARKPGSLGFRQPPFSNRGNP